MTTTLMGEEWYNILKEEMQQPYFSQLRETLRKEYTTVKCYPKPDQIFRTFQLTTPESIKVVIIGQDPYPFGQADGLAFSTSHQDTPYSLQRILREVDRDIVKTKSLGEFKQQFPTNDLSSWAKQGVLLLNSVLTVRANEVGSHNNIGWEYFNKIVLRCLVNDNHYKVFCLWGKSAEELCKELNFQPNHKVLKAGHPASGNHGRDKFSGCNHFSKTNYYFWRNGVEEINWTTK